jgi:hypothetical protein
VSDDFPKPSTDLVKRVLTAGANAGREVLQAAHRWQGAKSNAYAGRLRQQHPGANVDELVARVIRAHVMLARSDGVSAGVTTSVAEATTVIGSAGTLTLPTAITITAIDLTGLAWIQLRMFLIIAALYGHDAEDPVRVREFLTLQGALTATGGPVAAPPVTEGAKRVSKRLLMRYLRGRALESITALFRVVGIKFSRAAILRNVFLLNIPVNAVVNDAATRRLGRKAKAYFATLPASGTVGA